jgi:hypothetical protein
MPWTTRLLSDSLANGLANWFLSAIDGKRLPPEGNLGGPREGPAERPGEATGTGEAILEEALVGEPGRESRMPVMSMLPALTLREC